MNSDLLALADFDSDEYADRIAGLYQHCEILNHRAETLTAQTESRVAGMRKHTFKMLAEIGEALLRVQDARPGEFGDWFAARETRLGFSLRHAESCKAAARLVREHGDDMAYELSTAAKPASGPPPVLSVSFRLTRPLEELSGEERVALMKRLEPVVEIHHRLELLEGTQITS